MKLEMKIKKGQSFMIVEPHPDDEVFIPGFFAKCKHFGCDVYVVCVGHVYNIPPHIDKWMERSIAIDWFKENYLKDYLFLYNRWPSGKIPLTLKWAMKGQLINLINGLEPDNLVTFSPTGWYGHPAHRDMPRFVFDIYSKLDYQPAAYWFLNSGQGPEPHHKEIDRFPPTDILDIDWNEKVYIWNHYRDSVPALDNFLSNFGHLLDLNDRKEYFRRVR